MNIKPGMRIKVKDDWRKSKEYISENNLYCIPGYAIYPWKIMEVACVATVGKTTCARASGWWWPLDAIDVVGV